MKIVFYNESILSGGIEKSIENLIYYLSRENEIQIVYIDSNKMDSNVIKVLGKYSKVSKLENNYIIEADICIWCRLYMDYNKLKKQIHAKEHYLWVHSKPRELENCILDNKEFLKDVDGIICGSDTVKKMIKVDKPIKIIHNFLSPNIEKLANEKIEEEIFIDNKKLKLVTVSRLSKGKGFERVEKLIQMLEHHNVDFEYIVVGKGRAAEKEIKARLSKYKEVKFVGYKENPYPYIKSADYLVQLSDFETWCISITEAKALHTPVIVTNFETAYEQIEDDINGIIIDLYDNNYDKYLDRIINARKRYKENLMKFNYKNEIEEWNSLLKEN